MIRVGSLFSGIGGIEYGFEQAGGFETKWFVENNPYAQTILRKHWPNALIYPDIRKLDFTMPPEIDVLTGGFPCQDISIAGKGRGLEGERSGLWKQYLRAISEMRPRYALIENVPMLRHRGLSTILCDLAEIRYNAEWFSLSAKEVGALHKRERMFIIAYPDDNGTLGQEAAEAQWGRLQTEFDDLVASDAWGERVERHKQKTLSRQQGLSWGKDVRRLEDLQRIRDIPEPLLRRDSNGVSFRLDRIKCLGNAVVPQVAEFFAEIIKEKEVVEGKGGLK